MNETRPDADGTPTPAQRRRRRRRRKRRAPAPRTYRGLQLDPFQCEALDAIEAGRSVLVSAPTGTGKTLIADYLVEHALDRGGHVIYTAPIKALSNQKFREYSRQYEPGVVGLLTGDLVINRDAPLRIMTTEILRNMLLEQEPLEELAAVVVDEIHFLDDEERGTVWEEVLIHLPRHVRILGLSATLANLHEFAAWLSEVRGEKIALVKENERAVPLDHFLFNREVGLVTPEAYDKAWKQWRKALPAEVLAEQARRSRRRRRRRGPRHDLPTTSHVDVVQALSPDYLPLLYFIFSRKQTEHFARQLADALPNSLLGPHEVDAVRQRLDLFQESYPAVLTDSHLDMYLKGIAFHHAGAHVAIKALVEELYEQRLIRVLYCTSTFALGINMPARTVVFDGIMKYDGKAIVPLTVRQYMQKAGRAGRRGIDDQGYVVVRMDFQEYHQRSADLKRLRQGLYEPIRSSFNLSFNSVVSLLRHHDLDEIRNIVERSFLSFHMQRQAAALRRELPKQRARVEALAQQVADGDPSDRKLLKSLDRARRRLDKLEGRLAHAEGFTWEAFVRKVEVLQQIGYLGPNNEFLAGAEILQHIQIQEILTTELVLSGILDDLEPEVFFGVLAGLVQELPRSTYVRRPDDPMWYDLFRRVNRVRHAQAVRVTERLEGSEKIAYAPYLMPLGWRWAKGDPLRDILRDVESPTDVAGDLVGAFRRAKDLTSQIRSVYKSDPHRYQMLSELMRRVTRDEVEVID